MCRTCAITRRGFLHTMGALSAALAPFPAAGRPAANRRTAAEVAASMAVAAATGITASAAVNSVILGDGGYRYEVLNRWGELPPNVSFGDARRYALIAKITSMFLPEAGIRSSSLIGSGSSCVPGGRTSASPTLMELTLDPTICCT